MMGDKHANVTDLTAGVGVSLEDIHPAHASHTDFNPLNPIDTIYEEVSLNSDKVSCEDTADEDTNISIENKSSNAKSPPDNICIEAPPELLIDYWEGRSKWASFVLIALTVALVAAYS